LTVSFREVAQETSQGPCQEGQINEIQRLDARPASVNTQKCYSAETAAIGRRSYSSRKQLIEYRSGKTTARSSTTRRIDFVLALVSKKNQGAVSLK
jgi:hypothetical protein